MQPRTLLGPAALLASSVFASVLPADESRGVSHWLADIEPVTAGELALLRGRQRVDFVQMNEQELTASVRDNNAANTVTGNNAIDRNAFGNAGGVMSVIQNSGNNVLIQDTTIINITLVP